MRASEDIRFGEHTLRVQEQARGWAGIVLGAPETRLVADSREALIRKLERAAAEKSAGFIGWTGAKDRFAARHPAGFADPGYLRLERDDKEAARAQLLALAPCEAALAADGLARAVIPAFTEPTFQLIDWREVRRAKALLAGPDGDGFLRAAAAFCAEPSAATFDALRAIAAAHDALTWPILSYLPWLWAPDRHVFVKPAEMQAFARSVGHPFHVLYGRATPFAAYTAALDLAREVLAETAGLGARDNIDVQGFVYVVCHPGPVPPRAG